MIEIKTVSYDELPPGVDKKNLSDNGYGKEYATYMLIYYDGHLESVYSDAMEPEDVRFSRDLSWIQKEIEYAYNCGVKDTLLKIHEAMSEMEALKQ